MERGQKPRGYGEGNYKASARLHSCEMTMTGCWITANGQAHHCTACCLEKLQSAMPMTGTDRTDVLNKVTITKNSHKAAQGDKSLSVDLDLLIVGGIVRDGVKPM